ncbi:1-acyl-sn-glycerol-3-phosphate acyltransferase [Micromonospora acroterricola]|uniref:1-acyl-sn-glycerol-3-phosphate acyltransferase n=1 Tax=Micromonospora acroterricola TaxID=2202421 RepID=A0A317D5R0_9ACTN|nr:lysophospholipid acyltransferase family protein [Micromonospora acroterricola]PWR07915.1 1-acyl-sn-glycerol-3-phosphate acyltransferase [Micromonospora acroterricola]
MTAVPHDLWRPSSGCDEECLPAAGEVPTVPVARRVLRLGAGAGMLLAGVCLAVLLPVLPARERQAAVRGWARAAARAFGVRLVIKGRLPRRRALLVANHVSWLDILAVLAVAPTRMVAKREVRAWPVVGLLAAAAGTVFVDRSRPRALPDTVRRLAGTLRAGRSVAVFPEGTTWCARDGVSDCRPGGGFRPAMFQAAIDTGSPVVPLRLAYRCEATGAATTAAAFLGADTLLRSVARVAAARELVVSVTIAAALHPARDADRRLLARAAESAVHLLPSTGAAARGRLRPVPTVAVADAPTVAAPTSDAGRELDLAA